MLAKKELNNRLIRLRQRLDERCPDWQRAVVTQKVSLYYLTGTMAAGALWIPRDGDAVFFVRRGYDRALAESSFENIQQMNSFRDMAAALNNKAKNVLLEKNSMPLGLFELFNKYFNFERIDAIDPHLLAVRAVKSDLEIGLIRRAGQIHRRVLEDMVPQMLQEGISEAQLSSRLLKTLIDEGAHGIARFNMHDTDFVLGYVSFGENSLMPTNFDGPDGNTGLHPAAPFMGSRDRKLTKGDLVFIDVGCGFEGYHTDKTCIYCFGAKPDTAVEAVHNRCVDIMKATAQKLVPGNVPSAIYQEIMDGIDEGFKANFMGIGGAAVKFLGHGVGLHIDEPPAIAKGFDEPLEENMVIALEPKKAIAGVGMVGTENTFIVGQGGGEIITGTGYGIITV